MLGAAAAAEVERARQSGSRLLLAVVTGRHGLSSVTRGAIEELAAQKPSSQALRQLRESVPKKSSGTR